MKQNSLRVGIITFHRADNYGALLQTYALQDVLQENGNEAEIIDYRCEAIERAYHYRIMPRFRLNAVRWMKWLYINIKHVPRLKRKAKKFERFRDEFLRLSSSYRLPEDRTTVEEKYDLIITGSDQIWNPRITHGKDDWYAFRKKSGSAVVVSYAASAGNLSLFRMYYNQYREDLERYECISVREHNLRDFLAARVNKPVYAVSDPTFLIGREKWEKMTVNPGIQASSYIFYYDVDSNETSISVVRKLASEKKLDIVFFTDLPSGEYNKICAEDAGPGEFLGLIKSAKYVVTSSFHATVFSLIFQKQFIAIPHPRTGKRVATVLKDIGLESRLLDNTTQFSAGVIDEEINWPAVQKEIDGMKEESMKYLSDCIREARRKKSEKEP